MAHMQEVLWVKVLDNVSPRQKIKTTDDKWWSLWQVWTIYNHSIFGRVSISINYCLTIFKENINRWMMAIQFLCNIAKWQTTIIVCHHFLNSNNCLEAVSQGLIANESSFKFPPQHFFCISKSFLLGKLTVHFNWGNFDNNNQWK